jgi:hypothetical protein
MADRTGAACENQSVNKTLRRVLGVGLLAGLALAVWRTLSARSAAADGTGTTWKAQPFPFPPQPAIDDSPWIDAAQTGACPAHHPVKAKLTSGIFHVPGGSNYTRTVADRCYLSPEAAEDDGLRASKN